MSLLCRALVEKHFKRLAVVYEKVCERYACWQAARCRGLTGQAETAR